jgi:hypothetical protein
LTLGAAHSQAGRLAPQGRRWYAKCDQWSLVLRGRILDFMVKIIGVGLLALAAACSVYDPSLVAHEVVNAQRIDDDAGVEDAHPPACARTNAHISDQCTLPHADATCVAEQCLIVRCAAPYVDCDADSSNGCETTLDAPDHCGSCSNKCDYAHAAASCERGQCRLSACDDGFADCDKDDSNGCEAQVGERGCGECNPASESTAPSACANCGSKCMQAPFIVSSRCGSSGCELACQSGRANCDAVVDNGCETLLTDAHSCGACKNDCTSLPHAETAGCNAGVCNALTCKAGFADCNADPADGCERSTLMASDCGGCDHLCTLPHATSGCDANGCTIDHCDAGWGDCDGAAANGCETPLDTTAHCGACKSSCRNGSACNDGACGCSTDAHCGAGGSCCSGKCIDNTGMCFVWPCIPGTELSRQNCGACGQTCLTWCCGSLIE